MLADHRDRHFLSVRGKLANLISIPIDCVIGPYLQYVPISITASQVDDVEIDSDLK